ATGSQHISLWTSSDPLAALAAYTTVAPTSVSGLSVTLSSTAAGAQGASYSLSFSASGSPTSTTGALPTIGGYSGVFVVQAPRGTVFASSATVQDVTGKVGPYNASVGVTASGSVATVSTPFPVSAGDAIVVTLNDVTNTTTTGSPSLSVWTSSDTKAVNGAYSIVAGSAPTPGTATLSSNTSGATSVTYTVPFVTSATTGGLVAGQGTVTVSAPTGTVFSPSATMSDSTQVWTYGANVSVAGNGTVATVTVPNSGTNTVKPGDDMTVTLTGVTNTTATGSQSLSLWTSSDETPASLPYTISGGATPTYTSVGSPTLSVSSAAVWARGITYSYTFTTSGSGAMTSGSRITLSAPVGTVFPIYGCDYEVIDTTSSAVTGCASSLQMAGTGNIATVGIATAVAAGDSVNVIVAGMVNDGSAAAQHVTVSTTADLAPVSFPYTLAAPGVPSVSATLSTLAAGAHGVTYNYNVTTSSKGALAGREPPYAQYDQSIITLQAPPGTYFPNSSCDYEIQDLTNAAGNENCVANVTFGGTGNIVDITLQAPIAAGDNLVIEAAGVTNRDTTGSDALSVLSTSDAAGSPGTEPTLAAASTPSGTSATFSTNAAGAAGVTYAVNFTTSGEGALAGRAPAYAQYTQSVVTLLAPPGTMFPGSNCAYSITDHTNGQGSTVCASSATVAGTGNIVDLVLGQPVNAGHALTVTVAGVRNPFTTGADPISVATSSDAAASANPVPVLSAPAATASPSVAMSNPVAGASRVTYRVKFTTSSTGALAEHVPAYGDYNEGIVTIAAPVGTELPGNNCYYQVTDETDGTGSSNCVANVTLGGTGNIADLTLASAVPAGHVLVIEVAGVMNPDATAAASIALSSTSDAAGSGASTLQAAAAPSGVSVAPSTTAGGAWGVTYIVDLTLPSNGALAEHVPSYASTYQGAVTLAAPAGTVFPSNGCSYQVTDETDGTGSSNCVQAAYVAGTTGNIVDLLLSAAVPAGHKLEIEAVGVVNSTKAGTVSLTVSTTASKGAGAKYTITAPKAPLAPSFHDSNATPSATGVSYSVGFTTSATGALAERVPAYAQYGEGQVVMSFATATILSGSTCNYQVIDKTNSAGSSNCVTAVTLDGSTVYLTLAEPVAAGDSLVIEIAGVTNGPEAPALSSVTTSSDTA
ncbi:MAG: beta strand repeat-containing protein, partial [Acidimicrobiales bacterium]